MKGDRVTGQRVHSVAVTRDRNGLETPNLDEVRLRMQHVERDLLGPEANIPPQFKRLWEVRTPAGHAYARLYEIERHAQSVPTSGSAR